MSFCLLDAILGDAAESMTHFRARWCRAFVLLLLLVLPNVILLFGYNLVWRRRVHDAFLHAAFLNVILSFG